MPLVNQTLSLSKAAVYTACLFNFPLACPAFPQSCLLLEKMSPLKVDMNLQRKEVMKPGAAAENKCQSSSFFHLVRKSLSFPHNPATAHMNRASPATAPLFPKRVLETKFCEVYSCTGKRQTGMTNEKLKETLNHLYVLVVNV